MSCFGLGTVLAEASPFFVVPCPSRNGSPRQRRLGGGVLLLAPLSPARAMSTSPYASSVRVSPFQSRSCPTRFSPSSAGWIIPGFAKGTNPQLDHRATTRCPGPLDRTGQTYAEMQMLSFWMTHTPCLPVLLCIISSDEPKHQPCSVPRALLASWVEPTSPNNCGSEHKNPAIPVIMTLSRLFARCLSTPNLPQTSLSYVLKDASHHLTARASARRPPIPPAPPALVQGPPPLTSTWLFFVYWPSPCSLVYPQGPSEQLASIRDGTTFRRETGSIPGPSKVRRFPAIPIHGMSMDLY